jgi:hypothetical protein
MFERRRLRNLEKHRCETLVEICDQRQRFEKMANKPVIVELFSIQAGLN